jgi:heme-degrading monooxygenase HmoA
MQTIVTHVRIRPGEEGAWDDAFRERATAAREQQGFVSVQLCKPEDAPSSRVVIGTWQTREDWQRWHGDEAFLETRRRLEETDDEKTAETWHEVVVHEG